MDLLVFSRVRLGIRLHVVYTADFCGLSTGGYLSVARCAGLERYKERQLRGAGREHGAVQASRQGGRR